MMLSTHRASADVVKMAMTVVCCIGLIVVVGCTASEEMMQQHAREIAVKDKQIDSVRTENTSLRQRIIKLEQDSKNLDARLSESESKVMTERDRADKAEAALRALPTKATPPVKEMPKEPAKETKEASKEAVKVAPKEPVKEISSAAAKTSTAYQEALESVRAKKYDEGITKFEALLGGGIGDDLADNCHYWIGEAKYATKQYQDAIKHFEMVMNYAKSEKVGDAYYMMGQCYDKMGNKAKAKELYEKVVKDFPTNAKVKVAKERVAKM